MVKITDLFTEEQLAGFTDKGDGNLIGACPSCGKHGGYSGFVIFTDSNTCFCHGSKTKFDILETVALLKGLITCREGRSE